MVGRFLILITLFFCINSSQAQTLSLVQLPRLSFTELEALSQKQEVNPNIQKKLNKIFNSIILDNHIYNVWKPHHDKDLSRSYLRLSQWNIERGLNLDLIKKLFLDDVSEQNQDKLSQEIKILRESDIIVFNEVDLGVSRTSYTNVAAELAKLYRANYVFAPEFLELSPNLLQDPQVDKLKYRGLHGNVIVSKYPIVNPRTLVLPLCYDWFEDEYKNLSIFEHARRQGSKLAVDEVIYTEIRRGSRLALIADIKLNSKTTITVVNVHLENRTQPKCREKQMQVILDFIKSNNQAVILAGDLNNFENSAEPTSLKKIIGRRIQDPQFILRTVINIINPYALSTNVSSLVIGGFRKLRDPTVTGVPVVLPNKSRRLFDMIEKFRFDDGGRFDFGGEKQFSYQQRNGNLSNSNQRAKKGFVETFQFQRSYSVAKFKIDWIFVKPNLDQAFSPAHGQTLKALNYSSKQVPISDHSPVTVKLLL